MIPCKDALGIEGVLEKYNTVKGQIGIALLDKIRISLPASTTTPGALLEQEYHSPRESELDMNTSYTASEDYNWKRREEKSLSRSFGLNTSTIEDNKKSKDDKYRKI